MKRSTCLHVVAVLAVLGSALLAAATSASARPARPWAHPTVLQRGPFTTTYRVNGQKAYGPGFLNTKDGRHLQFFRR